MLFYNAWQKACQSATTKGLPHLPFAMWSTLMHDFQVPVSSALSVNSSGLSLTGSSGYPFFSYRPSYLKGPQAFPQLSYFKGTMIVNLYEVFSNPLRGASCPPHRCSSRYSVRGPSPSSCWFASNVNALIKLPHIGPEELHAL